MAGLPSNAFQQVQTYQRSELAFLLNLCCFLSNANGKFKNFDKMTANLGTSVTFDLPPRSVVTNNLVINPQAAIQRVQTLTVDQQVSSAIDLSNQQWIFNARDYMDQFGKSQITVLGNNIEANLAKNLISGVSNNDPTTPNLNGTLNTASGPYRFFGDGLTPINSVTQLANMLAMFRNYGCATHNLKGFLSDIAYPQIVGTMLNQFVPARNEKEAMSWEVGNWNGATWYQSNLLPIQTAGNVGNNGTTLTVLSVNDPTGAAVTAITFSGASATDAAAIMSGDLGQFQDGISGKVNLRYLTFNGYTPSANPVQIRATATAASDGSGHVTINITPPLCWQSGNQNQNLNRAISTSDQMKFLPSHRAGLVMGGEAFFLGMPQLPDQVPFPTVSENDKSTGASLRHYYGTVLGQNQQVYVRDAIFGSYLVPEYSMRVAFPLTQ